MPHDLRDYQLQAVENTRQQFFKRKITSGIIQAVLRQPKRGAPPTAELVTGQSLRDIAARAAAAAERHAITEALRAAVGNKTRAARALQTDFKTLHIKMKQLGLKAGDFTV